MNIVYTPNLPEILTNSTLVIDTCTIIDTTKSPDFFKFIRSMINDYNVTLTTIPAVKQEVLGVADNKTEYSNLNDSMNALDILFLPPNVESKFEQFGQEFNIAIRRSPFVNKPSFVDRLLLSIPFLYRKSAEKIFIITSNHKDIPLDFFDREAFIARDNGKTFSEVGIYKFNSHHFQQISKHI